MVGILNSGDDKVASLFSQSDWSILVIFKSLLSSAINRVYISYGIHWDVNDLKNHIYKYKRHYAGVIGSYL
jgi:hypothetical protein